MMKIWSKLLVLSILLLLSSCCGGRGGRYVSGEMTYVIFYPQCSDTIHTTFDSGLYLHRDEDIDDLRLDVSSHKGTSYIGIYKPYETWERCCIKSSSCPLKILNYQMWLRGNKKKEKD